MIIKLLNISQGSAGTVNLRCPACRRLGTFEALSNVQDISVNSEGKLWSLGQRRCPNRECYAHVFFVLDAATQKVTISYPAERLDFDPTGIPKSVVDAFEEAITCHAARCFVAAAIMVRKTLEELCRDRGAAGKDLKDRIKALETQVTLPKELFEGLDHLRLLGNDAAHIESRAFDTIGQPEVEVAIDFTKEVLKAVYQYKSLVERMWSLTKKP